MTMIVVDMMRKLQNMKCGEDIDVRAHFTKLDNMRNQISAMGKNFMDEEYASILLGSLPSCYASTTSGMNAAAYYSGQPTTPNGVVKLITNEYNRWMITQGKSGNSLEEAFASQDRKIDCSKVECYNCHKKGHYKSECWCSNQQGESVQQTRERKGVSGLCGHELSLARKTTNYIVFTCADTNYIL